MSDFCLRRIRSVADWPAYWRLDQICFPPEIAYSPTEMRQALAERFSFHLRAEQAASAASATSATSDGDAAPLIGFILSARRAERGHIITLDVAPEHRQQGIGQALMEATEHHFAGLGCRGMRLEAAVNNHAALRFYTRLGYRVLRTLPGYYASDLDGLCLEKEFRH